MAIEKSKVGWIALGIIIIAFTVFLYIVLRVPQEAPPKRPIWEDKQQKEQSERIKNLESQLEAEKRQRWQLGNIALETSDSLIRKAAKELSSHPRFLAWLANDHLINRFVAAVDNISRGESPAAHVPFLRPKSRFRVIKKGELIRINPRSYSRYNLVVDVFESINLKAASELYTELLPLLQESYRRLGYPHGDFRYALKKAIIEVLKTPVVRGVIYLKEKVVSYAYADPALEARPAAQKHIIRMGPENTRRLQKKLRELAIAIGIDKNDLPGSRTYTARKPVVKK